MHAKRPLQPDNPALDAWQQPQGQEKRQGKPDDAMDPQGRFPYLLDHQHRRHNDMRNHCDGEIGRGIIGAVVMQGSAAMAALRRHGEIGLQKGSDAAAWAFQPQAAPDGFGPGSVIHTCNYGEYT